MLLFMAVFVSLKGCGNLLPYRTGRAQLLDHSERISKGFFVNLSLVGTTTSHGGKASGNKRVSGKAGSRKEPSRSAIPKWWPGPEVPGLEWNKVGGQNDRKG